MATVIKPPQPFSVEENPSVFLCGTINMGDSVDWQSQIVERWADLHDVIVLNPRRDDWDSSWEQSIENDKFREQVSWELSGLESADVIAAYLDPSKPAPVSLMEIGLFAHHNKLIVCCPAGFHRKGNVDIVCRRYKIPQVDTLDELAERVRHVIELKEFQSLQGYWRD